MSRESKPSGIPDGVRRAFRLPSRSRAQTGRDLDDEVSFHLDMRIAELRAAGLSHEAARAEALRRFGDTEELRDYCQAVDAPYALRARIGAWMQSWMQDVRFAVRQLRRTPGFTIIAVLTLALGIGANTAIFSVVQHVLLAPIPYRGGDRIVRLLESVPMGDQAFVTPTAQMLHVWQARSHTLEQIVGYSSGDATLVEGSTSEVLASTSIASDMLPFLGVRPLLGRNFTPNDTVAGAPPVALLGYGVWQRRYGGTSDVLGKLVKLNGQSFAVIGVMPRGLGIPLDNGDSEIWIPLHTTTLNDRVHVIGRLRSGSTATDATRELSAITASTPEVAKGSKSALVDTRKDLLGDSYRRTLIMLFGAVGLVLLIACANVANLLLVRAGGRQREFAVRSALGAGRGRLVRQVLTESMLLALAGCAAGLLLAWRGLDLIVALAPGELSDLAGIHLEPVVLAWSLGVSVITGIVFGLAPALLVTEHTVGETLKSSSRSASGSARANRVRGALVISEIAVSVILLVGATLLMRSFSALERVDPGFDPRGVTGIAIEMPKEHFSTPVSRHAALVQVLDAVRRVPGVASAAVSSDMPPGRGVAFGDLMIDGRTLAASERLGLIGYASSGADYFRVTGIPLREGRIFVAPTPDASDSAAAQSRSGEIMVNQRFAKHYWPAGGAVGARIRIGDAGDWNTIVGVVGDVQRPGDLGAAAGFRIYAPFPATVSDAEILVRSSVASGALVARLTTAITHADPFIRVHQAQTAESLIADAVAQPRFAMILVGAFALLAVILAVVGLYGVMTYSVSQRTREIGVRIALGAHPREVIALVLRQGFILAAIGIVIGVAAAAGAARVIRSLLFGVSSGDPLTFVAVSVLIASIAAVACYIPARRAALIDPVIALRTE